MEYTYYGDLLGISSYYTLSPDMACKKLDDFYNTTFNSLSNYCNNNRGSVEVIMFSDSLLIRGDNAQKMLEELCKVYIELSHKGLLLRGAMVKGRLKFEPRLTLENFEKRLPEDDTLARSVGLESMYKGARLIIENSLVEELLSNQPQWMTLDGYVRDVMPNIRYKNILRRIAPTPDNSTYELLYFWVCSRDSFNYEVKKEQLKEISNSSINKISIHYKETIRLLDRCQHRQNFTERRIP